MCNLGEHGISNLRVNSSNTIFSGWQNDNLELPLWRRGEPDLGELQAHARSQDTRVRMQVSLSELV